MKNLIWLALASVLISCQMPPPMLPNNEVVEPAPKQSPVVDVPPLWKLKYTLPKLTKKIEWQQLSNATIHKAFDENKIVVLFVYDSKEDSKMSANILYGMRVYTLRSENVIEAINKDFVFVGVDIAGDNWMDSNYSRSGAHDFSIFLCEDAILQLIEINEKKKPDQITWPVVMFYMPESGHVYPNALHGFINALDFVNILGQIKDNAEMNGHKEITP